MEFRGCIMPVDPIEVGRPSVKASDCKWQVLQDIVPFPDKRVS
jgi:hypothetical protein